MKKSNKQKINPDELMKDTDKLMNFINKIENIDLETVDLTKLEEEITLLEGDLRDKYKVVLPKNYKNNLDTKK